MTMTPGSNPLPAPAASGAATASKPKFRAPVSSILIFVIMIVCILVPSPLTLNFSSTSILPSAQSLNPLRHLKGQSQITETTKPTTPSEDSQSSPTTSTSGSLSAPISDDKQQEEKKPPQNPQVQTTTDQSITKTDENNQTAGNDNNEFENDNDDESPTTDDSAERTESDSTPPPGLKQCGHLILFTAPRHGSTWFVDCAERCAFTLANNGTFGDLNLYTELWNNGQRGPVLNISVTDAIEYVKTKMSLKLFPSPYRKFNAESLELVSGAYASGVPLVLLTRSLDAAYKSFATAQQVGVWNANLNSASSRQKHRRETSVRVEIDPNKDLQFRQLVQSHYDLVKRQMEERGFKYDVIDYDDIKTRRYITLPNSECYVQSCNFQ